MTYTGVTEYMAHMGPMVATAGLLVAWVVQSCRGVGGQGLMTDMTLGLAGSVIAGALVALTVSPSMPAMFLVGGVGAMVALAVQRGVWNPVARHPGARAQS